MSQRRGGLVAGGRGSNTFHAEKESSYDVIGAPKGSPAARAEPMPRRALDGEVAAGARQSGQLYAAKNIKHRKEYEAELPSPPHYRLTRCFVDKRDRARRGVRPGASRAPWT